MKYSSLDTIVKGVLMNKGYTLHWYLQCLKYASDCLRELAMDDLKIINSASITLTPYSAAPIPVDCIDWIRIGIKNGEYVKPLTQVDGYNRMYNYGTNGLPKPWPDIVENLSDLAYFGVPFLTYYVNQYNSRGENIGGLFGYRTDGSPFTFMVVKERNEIQLDPQLHAKTIVLDYISDGRSASAVSMVDTYAEACIEAWCYYQFSEHNRSVSDSTKERLYQKYVGQRVVLRGRQNDLTADDILGIFRNNYNASPKT